MMENKWFDLIGDISTDFEYYGDNIVGRVVESADIEGVIRIEKDSIRTPSVSPSLKHDPIFIRQGSPYVLTLHLRVKRPDDVTVYVDLIDSIKMYGIMLTGTKVDDDGLIKCTVVSMNRMEVSVGAKMFRIIVAENTKQKMERKKVQEEIK